MSFLTERKYSFTSNALDADTFAVVDFTGEEGLSQPYRFDITLVTDNPEIDLAAVVQNSAKFTIHREQGDDVFFNGILTTFEQQNAVDGFVFYRAVLVPRLWWLTLTHHNQVFLNKTVQEMVTDVLKDGGLTTLDFEFRLQGSYAPSPYACQYGESHYHFVSRWLAREGIYYYFEQHSGGEKVIITDTAIAHKESRHGGALHFAPPSGLGDAHRTESVQGFLCRWNILPCKVLLKDYNYEKPSLEITGTAVVDEKGKGEFFFYGDHFRTPEEGNRLAKILAQGLLCRRAEYIGESTAPYIQPGFTFDLQDHYRSSFNQKYLTVEMRHEGSQTGYLTAGVQKGLSDRERRVFYGNQFTAIPASVQYRAPRPADRPKITGSLNAKIDAAGSGKYAELDEQGRYKVILPFDMSGRKDGKASGWLRMVQPYSGSDHGMHFPLHKGTEVILSFIEGDPDRPLIAGAAPNPETPSPVTGADQTMAKITTAGGNKIHMEDKDGSQRILLHTPTAGTFLRLGSHNDPPSTEHEEKPEGGEWGVKLVSEKGIAIQAGGKNEIILGEDFKMVTGSKNDVVLINENKVVIALCLALELAIKGSYGPEEWTLKWSHERAAEEKAEAIAESLHAHGQRLDANADAIAANGQHVEAIGVQIQAKDNVTRAIMADVAAHGESIRAHGQSIRTHGDSIQAHGQAINAHGQSIKTIGSAMKTVGSKMEVAAQHMFQCGSKISNAGLKLEEGGVTMRSAGLIVDG